MFVDNEVEFVNLEICMFIFLDMRIGHNYSYNNAIYGEDQFY